MNQRHTRRRMIAAVAATAALAVGVAGCSSGSATSASKKTDSLEIVSWWTSGSEAAALSVLLHAFKKANPSVTVTNTAVPGGAGSNAKVALAQRLLNGDPPDVWQSFAGRSLHEADSLHQIRSLSSVYDDTKLDQKLVPAIRKAVTFGGKPFGMPTSSHRSNVLFYNAAALKKAGVAAPGGSYSLTQFLADLKKVKAAHQVPLCLGAHDEFTEVELFENILLSHIGASGWKQIKQDKFNWRGHRVKAALRDFGTVLDYAAPNSGSRTWDQAAQDLEQGKCAFDSMNDSAYGEIVKDGGVNGTTFGTIPFPGTADNYLAVIDTFVVARKAKNARNGLAFARVIASPATQVAFSKQKGSVPVLAKADVSTLSAYQRSAYRALTTKPVLLSLSHGELLSSEFEDGLFTAVDAYTRSRDANVFASDLESAVNADKAAPAH